MWRQVSLAAVAVLLAIPPLRFALNAPAPEVDRTSAAWQAREALIARAHVFVRDPPDPAQVDFEHIEPEVECQFVPEPASGTTSKFDCRLAAGEVVKVKYGLTHERYGEVAAARLLRALGFAADRASMAAVVRCLGCPAWPFELRTLADQFLLGSVFERSLDYGQFTEFHWASVEHQFDGREVEVDSFEGWDWRELAQVDPSAGGATAAQVDALRLIGVFLAHWDSKASNQRLVCLGETACDTPILMLHDVGATFGPSKVNHARWSLVPIWADPAQCVVSMDMLPFGADLFPPVQISEQGRTLLAERLQALSRGQIEALFRGARFPDPETGESPASDLTPWVRTFEQKVREIAHRAPCPSAS
jgi:hypothetical protein